MSIRSEHVAILGTGMTDMSRRDLSPSEMAHQAVHEALADAAIEPEQLALVVASNAMGGRLCDQGSIRAQSWLRKAGLGSVPVVNVDNSCAGGAAAVQMATLAARAGSGPVLVLGVEKMWTGDRAATLAGIEDGLPADYRADMHARFVGEQNPGGSILMALNDRWAHDCIAEHGATLEQFAAAAVKARLHASWNPNAQIQQTVTVDEVLAAPQVSGILTRLMCSSFTDGAAALVLTPGTGAPLDAPRIIASVARSGNGEMDYHKRLAETASAMWEESGLGPADFDLAEIHDATSPEEIYALESLGLFGTGEAGPATVAGDTTIGGRGLCVNPSGGLVGRGHPLGATGLAQLVELAIHLRGRGGHRQVPGARLGLAVNTGGIIEGDAAYIGMHAVAAGSR
ncbi:MAG: thiolase family protein [Actinomycetota bacterium]|nr:thiolase family protein [Actinomycetota bacterium]